MNSKVQAVSPSAIPLDLVSPSGEHAFALSISVILDETNTGRTGRPGTSEAGGISNNAGD